MEDLGNAVLNLTATNNQLIAKEEEALMYTKRTMGAMGREVDAFNAKLIASGQVLSKGYVAPLETSLKRAETSVLDMGAALEALNAATANARHGLSSLASEALGSATSISRAMASIRDESSRTAAKILESSAAEKFAVNEVTRAYIELAAAQAAVGDPRFAHPAQIAGAAQRSLGAGNQFNPAMFGGIMGARGSNAVGGTANPMVVALESGSAAALGSRAAAVGAQAAGGAPQAAQGDQSGGLDEDALATAIVSSLMEAQRRQRVSSPANQMTRITQVIPEDRQLPPGPQTTNPNQRLLQQAAIAGLLESSNRTPGQFRAAGPAPPLYSRPGVFVGGQSGEQTVRVDPAQYAGLVASAMHSQASTGSPGAQSAGNAALANALGAAAGGSGSGGGNNIPPVAFTPPGGGGGGGNNGGIGALLSSILIGRSGLSHSGVRVGVGPFALPFPILGAGAGSLGSFAGLGVEHFLLTALGIAGSAGTAVGGAGTLLAGGLGAAAAGGGSDALITAATVAQTKQLVQAQTQIQQAQQALLPTQKEFAKTVKEVADPTVTAAYDKLEKDISKFGINSHQAETDQTNLASAVKSVANPQLTAEYSKFGSAIQGVSTATAGLNAQMKALGGGPAVTAEAQLAKNYTALKTFFDKESQDARVAAATVLEQIVKLGHDYVPLVTQAALQNLTIINKDLKPLFSWLEGPQGMGIFENLENNFRRNLPTAIDAFNNGIEGILRFMSIASNYTGGFVKELDKLMHDLNDQSDATLEDRIQRLIGDFRIWENFVKALGNDIHLLFKQDVGTGQSIIVTLTGMLDKLGEWEASTKGSEQLHTIFEVHKDEVLALLHVMDPLASTLGHFYLEVAPPMTRALTGIVTALTDMLIAIEKMGPVADNLLAMALIASKLGILGTVLRGVGGALGLIATEEKAVATGAAAIGTSNLVAGGATAGGSILSRLAPSAMAGAAGRSIVGKVGGSGIGAGLTAEGLGMILTPVVAAGAGVAGGAIAQHALGLKGGVVGTVAGGGVGAVAGGAIGTALGGPIIGTAIGAGIGATLGPTIGHLLGDLFGHKSGQDLGKQFAEGFSQNLTGLIPPKVERQLQQSLVKAVDQRNKDNSPNQTSGVVGFGQTGTPSNRNLARDNFNVGHLAGEQVVEGLKSVKVPTTAAFLADFQQKLSAMPAYARNEAARTMLSYAQQLQTSGALPKGSVNIMIQSLEAMFPALTKYLQKWGMETSQDMTETMKFNDAKNQLVKTIENMRGHWGDLQVDAKVTGANMVENFNKSMTRLHQIADTTTGATKKDALNNIQELHDQAIAYFNSMQKKTSSSIGNMKDAITGGSQSAAKNATAAFNELKANVTSAVDGSVLTASQGYVLIAQATNALIKSFGGGQIPIPALVHAQKLDANPGAGISAKINPGGAQGGLFQFGQSGDRGQDNIPLSFGGNNITVGAGEVGAVLTAPQQRVLNQRLGDYGGLPGFFSKVNTPHWMADAYAGGGPVRGYDSGGVVRAVGSELMGHGLNKIGASGIIGNAYQESTWNPASVGDGGGGLWGFTASPISLADLQAYAQSQHAAWTNPTLQTAFLLGHVDGGIIAALNSQSSPQAAADYFMNNWERPLASSENAARRESAAAAAFKFLSGVKGALGNFAISGGGGGGTSVNPWTDITAPKVKGTGALADMDRAALKKATAAANAYGEKQGAAHMTVTGGGGGGGGGGPVFPVHKGPVPPQVQWALAAAENIAAKNLPYGHDGAGWGLGAYDCSSYVSTVMDAAGIWPKWTYYTAAGPINANTDPGPGKWITIATWGTSGQQAHTMMEIDGKYFESGGSGGGPHVDGGWSMSFDQYRHPKGFAQGGQVPRGHIGEPGYQPTDAQVAILRAGGSRAKKLEAELNPGLKNAGNFAQGGAYTANSPTMAIFGENGPETAFFVPHATGGLLNFQPDTSYTKTHTTTTTDSGGKKSTSTTDTTSTTTSTQQKTWHYDALTGGIVLMTSAEWSKRSAEIEQSQKQAAKEKKKYEEWLHKIVTDPITVDGVQVGEMSFTRGLLQKEQLPLGSALNLNSNRIDQLPKLAFSHVTSALSSGLKADSEDQLLGLSTRFARSMSTSGPESGLIKEINNLEDEDKKQTTLLGKLLTQAGQLHDKAMTEHGRQRKQNLQESKADRQRANALRSSVAAGGALAGTLADTVSSSRIGQLGAMIINAAAKAIGTDFTNQQTQASKTSSVLSLLTGMPAGTSMKGLNLSATQMSALGLNKGQISSLIGGSPDQVAGVTESSLKDSISGYKEDATKLTTLYKAALKTHNRKLQQSLLTQLDDVTQAQIQAQSDLKQAQITAITTSFSNMSDAVSALGDKTSTVTALNSVAPGTSLAGIGVNQGILNTLGIANGQGLIGQNGTAAGLQAQNSAIGTQMMGAALQLSYMQQRLGGLSGTDRNQAISTMQGLVQQLAQLKNTIDANNQAIVANTASNFSNQATNLSGSAGILGQIQNLKPGTNLSALGLTPTSAAALGLNWSQANSLEGTGMSYLQNVQGLQNGTLTSDQIAGAQSGVNAQNSFLQQQIGPIAAALNAYVAELPSLTDPTARQTVTGAIQQLGSQLIGLQGTIQDNNDALTQLTQATNANTNATGAMTGTVAYSYQGQNYLSSDNGINVGVGS